MVRCCCVKFCRNRSNRVVGLSYFSFPAVISYHTEATKELSTRRRQQWINAVGRLVLDPRWEPKDHHKVCSEHFVLGRPAAIDDFKNVDWVPTLKLPDLKSVASIQSITNKEEQSNTNAKVRSSSKAQSSAKSNKTTPANEELAAISEAAVRWKDWVALVNRIVDFVKTGKIDTSISSAKQEEVAKAAQIYYIESGVVYRRKNKQTRVVVISVEERDMVLEKSHCCKALDGDTEVEDTKDQQATVDGTSDSGTAREEIHRDFEATVAAIKTQYCWKGIKMDVTNWIRRCKKCSPSAAFEEDEFQMCHSIVLSDNEDQSGNVRGENSTKTPVSKKKKSKLLKLSVVNTGKNTSGETPVNVKKSIVSITKITPQQKVPSTKTVIGNKFAVTSVKTSTGTVIHPIKLPGTSKKLKLLPSVVSKPVPDTTPSSTLPKAYRPMAWLLHGTGIRLVREQVYRDLIEIQDQKDLEGQLGVPEQGQLSKLRGAYTELSQKNAYMTNNASPAKCKCGFSALLQCEMELHRDYGHASHTIESGRFDCCQCGATFTRSAIWIATHTERIHGRRSRSYTPAPPAGICPYCPFEQRTTTKCKLTRHIERCAASFNVDRNLAPLPADCDIPLIDTRPPSSASSLTTTTVTTATASSTSFADSLIPSSMQPNSVSKLNTSCSTVSAVNSITTPVETNNASPPKATTKSKNRLSLPEGASLQFEICELCGAFVRSRQSMVLHLTNAHRYVINPRCAQFENPPITCDLCTERFWTPIGLRQHVAKMHEDVSLQSPPTTVCPLCKRTRLTDVVEHLARQHRITLVDMFLQRYCSVCQLALHAARPFEHHMLTRHSELFADRAALLSAIVTVDHCTRGRSYTLWRGRQPPVLAGAIRKPPIDTQSLGVLLACQTCELEFPSDTDLKSHIEANHAFVCLFCSRRFSSAGFLRVHIRSAHENDTVPCETCGVDVDVCEMADHVSEKHVKSCSVAVKMLKCGGIKRRHSISSISNPSSEDEIDEQDVKRCKILVE